MEDFSRLATPLTQLTKGVKFECNNKCKESSGELKQRLTKPILIIHEKRIGYTVTCDASLIGLGCFLVQQGRGVVYGSRQLKNYERTYS